MKLEERYVVLKISDIEKYLSTEKLFTPHSLSDKDLLDVVCAEIRNGRPQGQARIIIRHSKHVQVIHKSHRNPRQLHSQYAKRPIYFCLAQTGPMKKWNYLFCFVVLPVFFITHRRLAIERLPVQCANSP